jgi:two-component system, chemotaxis family, chemotaxis protein CheY
MVQSPHMSGRSILVVDDKAEVRQLLKTALEDAGYVVATAANGAEALARQRQSPAQVVITDLFMPDIDGFETIQALRASFPATRIVAISGDSERTRHEYLQAAQLIGVDATLRKPISIDALLQTLESLR